jgi:hypothetical protein
VLKSFIQLRIHLKRLDPDPRKMIVDPKYWIKKKNNNKRHIEPSTVAASAVPVAFSNRTEVNGVPLYQNHRNLTYRIYRIKLEPGSVYVVLTISHTGPDKYYGQENQWPHLELKKNIFN